MKWSYIIDSERAKNYFSKLKTAVNNEYQKYTVCPDKSNIFYAFKLCKYSTLKVVILGQDPYHGPNQAHGLAFSTPAYIANPPSMQNILKEINNTVGKSICNDGDLTKWAKQGVLLLNTTLTVRLNKPNSHKNLGWETFTDNIINYINTNNSNIVFLLWGASARSKLQLIDKNKHFVLTTTHPSPLSANKGFFGSNHFNKTNEILNNINEKQIVW